MTPFPIPRDDLIALSALMDRVNARIREMKIAAIQARVMRREISRFHARELLNALGARDVAVVRPGPHRRQVP